MGDRKALAHLGQLAHHGADVTRGRRRLTADWKAALTKSPIWTKQDSSSSGNWPMANFSVRPPVVNTTLVCPWWRRHRRPARRWRERRRSNRADDAGGAEDGNPQDSETGVQGLLGHGVAAGNREGDLQAVVVEKLPAAATTLSRMLRRGTPG